MNATNQAKQLATELLHDTSRSELNQTAVRRRLWLLDMIANMDSVDAACVHAGRSLDSRCMAR